MRFSILKVEKITNIGIIRKIISESALFELFSLTLLLVTLGTVCFMQKAKDL